MVKTFQSLETFSLTWARESSPAGVPANCTNTKMLMVFQLFPDRWQFFNKGKGKIATFFLSCPPYPPSAVLVLKLHPGWLRRRVAGRCRTSAGVSVYCCSMATSAANNWNSGAMALFQHEYLYQEGMRFNKGLAYNKWHGNHRVENIRGHRPKHFMIFKLTCGICMLWLQSRLDQWKETDY